MRLFKPLLACVVLCLTIYALLRWQTRASSWRERLEASPTITLYSLEPDPTLRDRFSRHLNRFGVLGQIKVSGHEKDEVVSAVRDAEWIYHNWGGSSCSFSPRVGIQTEDGQTRVLLCFSCGDGVSTVRGAREEFVIYPHSKARGKKSEDELNALLRRAHVPLSKPQW